MSSLNTPLLACPTRRNRRVAILAFTITGVLHALGLLALQDSLRPQPDYPQPEHRTLTVTLIPSETRRSGSEQSNNTIIISRATRQSRLRTATIPGPAQQLRDRETISVSRKNVSKLVALAVGNAGVGKSLGESIDWQNDLLSIDTHRSARYGNTPQHASRESNNHTQETTARLNREISKATRSDCRNRYFQMGLLAIPMLAVDAMNRSGCQW
ncbi:hypothetical protein [Burkholderia lata]|uniref:hypothetical protein n=1 Tax=Burkholderia lata (strain ATCC 17760 / DSM 23089 / LMG 22485 / NCIMB 9086 / R18194 / 383) TaxID=482957 RepID=UPI0015817514|nr:hypothetical protein [Burkholderia lata]